MALADDPDTGSTIFYQLRGDAATIHYALSEEAQLHLRYLRDAMRAVAAMLRGDEDDDRLVPEQISGDGMGAVFEVFALAADSIVAATPIAPARRTS